MKNLWVIAIILLLLPRLGLAHYLDPLGDGTTFGCGVAEHARTVFLVSGNGSRTKLPKKRVLALVERLKRGNGAKKKLACDLKKCLAGGIKSVNACDEVAPEPAGQTKTKIVQGRLCAQAPSAVVRVTTFINGEEDQHCTGVVLTPQIVLTAAHCLYTGDEGATSASVTTSS
jgi:hypothetical protein